MKYLCLFGLLVFAYGVRAQCGKSISWTAPKTIYINGTGAIQNIQEGEVAIETSDKHITITFKTDGGGTDIVEGELDSLICAWKDPFINGTTSFKSVMAKSNGETKNTTVTIIGKEGKITMTIALENANGMKIQMPISGYKIKS
jgi:hypothetical protein